MTGEGNGGKYAKVSEDGVVAQYHLLAKGILT